MQILLVRHGESLANIDKSYERETPDCMIPLSEKGKLQAADAGKFLFAFLSQAEHKGQKVRLWNSGYKRTRETTHGIMRNSASVIPEIVEDNRLREQDHGLFDGLNDAQREEMYPDYFRHFKKFTGDARYFAKYPMGESRADVEGRILPFFDKLKLEQEKGLNTAVIVTHGDTIKSFIKGLMNHPFEWGSHELNPGNCSIRLLETDEHGAWQDKGYIYSGKKEEIDSVLAKSGTSLPSLAMA